MTVAPQTGWPPTVGRYLLYGEIASGGMATVHFGRLQGAAGFARSVAIKRLHPQYAKDPDFVAMFLDEARLVARISHPNVVPTLDVVAQGDELLLVMEYVRGSALSRLLRTLTQKGERMPPRIAASVLAGALRGLHAAHEAKSEIGEPLEIVHRDVSPQNVLVGTDGIPRVLDFGVAKAAGRVQSTREGQLKGKLAYMAPEQITTGLVTRKTDVYAAAVVLWEMLTGRRLFRADNEAKLLSLVLDSEVGLPSRLVEGLPLAFDRIVMRGLSRDPVKRYPTARDMAIDVEAVVGIAPSTEVGEWVETVAADELRERANRIEEIERSVQGSSPSGVSNQWLGAGTTGTSKRIDEPSTVQHGVRPPISPSMRAVAREQSSHASKPGRPPERPVSQVSQVSHLSVTHTDPPKRSSTRPAGLIIAGTVAVCAIGVAVLAIRHSHSGADATRESSPASPANTLGSAHVATATEPSGATVPPSPAPHLSSGAAPGAAPTPATISFDALSAAPPVRAPPRPPAAFVPPAAAYTPRSPALAPQRPGVPDCTPPYTTDSKGHIHFKPACVN